MTHVVIENPAAGKTYCHPDKWGVYQYDTYPEGSVLAGQERRTMLDIFDSLPEAQHAYPAAEMSAGSGYREIPIPETPPPWFDPSAAGERWDDDY